jgi:hypothetical protein
MKELTLKQFNKICSTQVDDNFNDIDKKIEIIKVLGYTDDEIDNMDINTFKNKLTILEQPFDNIEVEEFITLDNHTFKLKGNPYDFNFTVKQIRDIAELIKDNQVEYVHMMMAYLYDNDQLDFKARADLFEEKLKLYFAIPFINKLKTAYELV